MVPAWSLLPTLVVGLIAGFVAARLGTRPAAAEPVEPAAEAPAPAEPVEPAAEAPAPAEPVAAEAAPVEAVVAELERRYKGRKVDVDPGRRP